MILLHSVPYYSFRKPELFLKTQHSYPAINYPKLPGLCFLHSCFRRWEGSPTSLQSTIKSMCVKKAEMWALSPLTPWIVSEFKRGCSLVKPLSFMFVLSLK